MRHLRIQRGNLCGLLLGLFDRIALHGRILSMHRVHGALVCLRVAAVLHLDVLHRRLKVFVAAHACSRLFICPLICRFLRVRGFEHFPARFIQRVQQLAQLGDFVVGDRAVAGHQRGHIIGHGLRFLGQSAFQRLCLRVQLAQIGIVFCLIDHSAREQLVERRFFGVVVVSNRVKRRADGAVDLLRHGRLFFWRFRDAVAQPLDDFVLYRAKLCLYLQLRVRDDLYRVFQRLAVDLVVINVRCVDIEIELSVALHAIQRIQPRRQCGHRSDRYADRASHCTGQQRADRCDRRLDLRARLYQLAKHRHALADARNPQRRRQYIFHLCRIEALHPLRKLSQLVSSELYIRSH